MRNARKMGGEGSLVLNVEIDVIEEVVSLGAKLQLGCLSQSYVFLKREIELLQSWPNHCVPGGVPKCI